MNIFSRLVATSTQKTPWVVSLIVAIIYTSIFIFSDGYDTLDKLGSYFSAAASSMAFVWLVAAFYQQMNELKLQRIELSLQRETSQQQAKEWKRIAVYTALEKANQILEQHEKSLANVSDLGCQSYNELHKNLLLGMQSWKTLLKSSDDNVVFGLYAKHAIIDGACCEFLSRYISAVELYEQASEKQILSKSGCSEEVLYFADYAKLDIPFIRHYSGMARAISLQLFITMPGRDRIQLRGLEAMCRMHPGVVYEEKLEALRLKVREREERQMNNNQN